MSFRTKFIFFAVISFLVVAGIILAIALRPKKSKITEEPSAASPAAGQVVSPALPSIPSAGETKKTLTAAELSAAQKEVAIKNTAKIFVERLGSYSPGANFANLDELKGLVTASVATWLEQYKKQLPSRESAGFLGVTTRVISQKLISSDATHASVLASTQREEIIGNSPNLYYKDMLVKLVWQNNQWLVDGAYWQ